MTAIDPIVARGGIPATERALVAAGAAAGPLFAVVTLAQAVTRAGFDLADHPLSLLALGPGGWMQIGNFVVCGAAFTAAAVALRHGGGVVSPWATRLIGTFGVATALAGVFPTDPWHDFPPGAAEILTWHGAIHGVAAGVGGLALVGAAVLVARHQRRIRSRLAAASLVVAVVSLAGGAAGSGAGEFRLAFVSGAVAWIWASVVLAMSHPTSDTCP